MREKASFLEKELREQLADTRSFLEEERRQRRAAEASLAQQLAQVQTDAAALRSRLVNAEGARKHHEVGYSGPQNRQISIQRAKSWELWKKIMETSSVSRLCSSPPALFGPMLLLQRMAIRCIRYMQLFLPGVDRADGKVMLCYVHVHFHATNFAVACLRGLLLR